MNKDVAVVKWSVKRPTIVAKLMNLTRCENSECLHAAQQHFQTATEHPLGFFPCSRRGTALEQRE
jgi:hypothetical protein